MDGGRGTAWQRGYDARWAAASRAWRYDLEHMERLWCADPYKIHERPKLSECVDHIVPHKGDMAKFWDKGNWQALCVRCNSIKAAREDGGFGNRRAE